MLQAAQGAREHPLRGRAENGVVCVTVDNPPVNVLDARLIT
ncbi:hypothetical protein [Actinosynnema pretiosum]|nr:hypothetical protein [Actinosynnema pretiosum]